MSLSRAFKEGVGSIVIIDDLYLAPNPDTVDGATLAAFLKELKASPHDCLSLGTLLGREEVTDPAMLVDIVTDQLTLVYNAHIDGKHPYLKTLFADVDAKQSAGLHRLRVLEAAVEHFFKTKPKTYGSLERAKDELAVCSIVFVDFFLEGVNNHEEARRHHASVSAQLGEKFAIGSESFPKVVVLMSTTLPSTHELALFRKDTKVRGAFFHTIDKAEFNLISLGPRLQGFVDAYESASQLNGYLETIEDEIMSAAEGLASDLSRLDVHDLTILKTLRLDGESDTPQAYLTLLLSEALAARVRMAGPLRKDVLPKEHTYGDAPFDGKLLPTSVLFELFVDIAVSPVPVSENIKVAFGDVFVAVSEKGDGKLLLAISPACDLQRCSIDYEVLCVQGAIVESNANLSVLLEKTYSFGQGNVVLKLPAGESFTYSSIKFDFKLLKTVPAATLQDFQIFHRIARLTEVFAQEVKTLALNHTARVGVPIDPSFSVGLNAKIRFSFTGDEQGAPKVEGEYDIDSSEFLPAVLAMGRQLGESNLFPTVMFSVQFKERLQRILSEKLTQQGSKKLNAVATHFLLPASYKVSLEVDSMAKSINSGLIMIKYIRKLPQLGPSRNFEILLYSELSEEVKPQAAAAAMAHVLPPERAAG